MNVSQISLMSLLLLLLLSISIFASDKDDIQASVDKSLLAFNSQNFQMYFSQFTEDNTEFPYVVSPLRHNATAWKAFIEGTASLAYVNYHQQDEQIQVYNGNTAVVTAYYTFTWMEKGGPMNYQSGRTSMVLVKQDGKWMTAHMHFSEMF